jgi:hypothetical protein
MSMIEVDGGMAGFVTHVEKDEDGQEKSVAESGIIIVLRRDGEEALFASRDSVPLRWIKIGDFTPDPAGVFSVEELKRQDEQEDD